MDNFDMLFTRMNDNDIIQQDLKTQLEANNRKVDTFVAYQKYIAEQVQANGQAVAQLTLCQFEDEAHSVGDSSVSIVFEEEAPFTNVFADDKGKNTMKPGTSKQHKPAFDPLKKATFDCHKRDNYDS